MILQTTGINLRKHVYDKSSFNGAYQHELLQATLKIDNGKEHLYLKEIKLHTAKKQIHAKFELKMQGQEFYGTIHGDLNNPKVSLDMKKLIRYQVEQQFGELLDNPNNQKIQKEINQVKEILKDVDVDAVTEQAKSLLEGFF